MSWIGRCIPALVVAIGSAMVPPLRASPVVDCPAMVRGQIDGLYRWMQEEQPQALATAIANQRQRFTPQLFELLERATALTPVSVWMRSIWASWSGVGRLTGAPPASKFRRLGSWALPRATRR